MFGGFFSKLFGSKRNDPVLSVKKEIVWSEIAPDDVLNCCEQVGAFEELNIEDSATINKVCEDIARLFNDTTKSFESLKNSFIKGFEMNSFHISVTTASTFASAYMDSYIYNEF